MRRVAVLVGVVAAAASIGCIDPIYYDSNASDPPAGGSEVSLFYASEPSVLYVPWAGEHRVLAAYNDQSGFYDIGPNNTLDEKPGKKSNMGLSYSLDAGMTWNRHGVILPDEPDCGGSTEPCATLMRGDPWLATNGERVLYSHMAITALNPSISDNQDAVAVSKSDDGGITWSIPQIAGQAAGLDKPSLDMSDATAVISFVNSSFNLYLTTSDDAGDTWSQHVLELPGVAQKANPIVKLKNRTNGYLAYMEKNGDANYDIHVVRIMRPIGGSTTWIASSAFERNDVQIDPFPQGALNRPWRDVIPVSFDIGEQGRRLLLVWRELNVETNRSEIKMAHCLDDPVGTCTATNGQNSLDWQQRIFRDEATDRQYQPNVTASKIPGNFYLAVTWYEVDPELGGPIAIEPRGTFSSGLPISWSPQYDIFPTGGPYLPCPTASATPTNPGYYGDYIGSAILPLEYGIDNLPWIVTAYANSSDGCVQQGALTHDHHVQAVVW